MFDSSKNLKIWTGIPPWILMGAAAVLLPLVIFITVENINRQKEKSIHLLLEKGAALIRSFEAGTRTGMMGRQWGAFQLQQLLAETAQQPDIVYLIVADENGKAIAHSNPEQIGRIYGTGLDLKRISNAKNLQWRQISGPDGQNVFEVYREFIPTGPPRGMGMMRRHHGMMGRQREPDGPGNENIAGAAQIIFVGLDMRPIEEARKEDVRHAVIMGAILLLVGFAGFTLLFLVQSYRSTRASLSRIKAFSDNIVENVPIGLLALDHQGRIAAFNRGAEAILQCSAPEVMGQAASKCLPAELLKEINHSQTHDDIIEKEIEYTTAEGKTVPLEIGASSIKDENNDFVGNVLLFKDLTEVRALRQEIARNQRLATVGRLAAGVAHEIRNPLSSIKGFATYFKERYPDRPQDQQTATIMIQEVDRLNRVVGQLLEFSRPIAMKPQKVSLPSFIADSIKLIEDRAAEKNISIHVYNNARVDEVRIDPDRINQVLLNLYLNAVDAMESGGELKVEISADGQDRDIVIQVSDTGSGISPEDLAKIFEPYFTTKSTGTGLGLAIAHNIIEAMGGSIKVTSNSGKGTSFRVTIPFSSIRIKNSTN
ncbi:MAG: PAS domain S-box protein [Deltaproteobacteria bacterium]|jgi:two-component system sensor histidine kinase HydH|nr:PAS domain S-box protein [Deltaproteobacteria bacterium]